MACSGCSNAIDRVLKRTDGVKDIDISLKEQTVDVTTDNGLSYDKVLETISKTGRKVNSGKVVA